MYEYNIEKNADTKAFERTCLLIEKGAATFIKEELLVDVDGTQIQIYHTREGKIKVVNDYEVDAVYVDAHVNLNNIFR
ncbi:MAG: hypothetical protein ACOX7J_06630 [Bacillota bacterium]